MEASLSLSSVPVKAKSSASETPVTISGLVMGMLVSVITAARSRPRALWRPTAAMVPRIVARTLERTAIIREFNNSRKRSESRKSSPYCERVKPLKTAMSLPVLKLATASTTMGI